jgi:hypothetical protein
VALALGLLLPLVILAAFAVRRDRSTHPRFYIAPAIVAVAVAVVVLTTDAGPTPDFWVGLAASLAGITGAGLALVLQSLLPLDWWLRDSAEKGDA